MRKLTLYVGLPSYGLLIFFIPGFVPDFHIIWYFNPVVLMMNVIIIGLDDANRGLQISSDIMVSVIVIGNISFWLTIAYYINRFLDNRRKRLELK